MMAYDTKLASRVKTYLAQFPKLSIEEKKMFGGLAFLVNGKMCVNIVEETIMCRFDPALTEKLSQKKGFLPMLMRERKYKGYCYVAPAGIRAKRDFEFWMNVCLDFNSRAKSLKKVK